MGPLTANLVTPLSSTATSNLSGSRATSPASLAASMLQVQMMALQEIDNQYREIGQRIKFLGTVKKIYRDNISTIQNFLTKNRQKGDDKEILKLSPAQMVELLGALQEVDYDLSKIKDDPEHALRVQPMQIFDSGDQHHLDEARDVDGNSSAGAREAQDVQLPPDVHIVDGKVSAEDYVHYFEKAAELGNSKEAARMVDLLGGDKTDRFFYGDKLGYTFEDGTPRVSAYVEQLSTMQQKIENQFKELESELEKLNADLNTLSSKRKSALDAMGDTVRKLDEARTNTVNKMA